MSNKINLLIDTVPYTPDIFNNTPSLYRSEVTNNSDSIPTYQSIFVFSLNYNNGLTDELNKYNNPYYMLYGMIEPDIIYSLPPINYFSISSQSSSFYSNGSNLIKIINKSYIFTPDIIELLQNIGYDTTPTSSSDLTPINSVLYDNKVLFQQLLIYDAVTGRNDEIIFLFFYQNYITDNTIHPNNSYIYNTTQTPFSSSVFYNKKNWNIFIYPYTYISNVSYNYTGPSYYQAISNVPNTTNTNTNVVESLNFNNEDYVQYLDKIDYKYFENTSFVEQNNKLNTSILHSKNLILFGNYYENSITESNNNLYISLNEIKKFDTTDSFNNTSENTTLKFLAKSKSYSNVNKYYSMSFDNKMGYINNKFNSNDLTYAPYHNNENRSKSLYPVSKNYFINTYINIANSGSLLLQSTNWYIRKLILQINPLIISNLSTVVIEIYPLIKCKNLLQINPNNNLQVIFVSPNTLQSTNNYYIDRFRLVVKWIDNGVNFVYYVILNIAYYNQLKFNISNTTKTTSIDDLGYINFTYIDRSNTLSPVIFQKSNNSNIFVNQVDYNMIDTKYYSVSLNYNLLSSNSTQYNLIFINHFYYLISYTKPTIYYTDIANNNTQTLISNIYNLLEKKINNFVTNIVFLSDNFYSIKFNNYNSESMFKLSITFDSNILNDFENCPTSTNDYINYLSYINRDFGNDVVPYIKTISNGNNYPQSSIMIPTGNYLVFKYHNNFITRNSMGAVVPMNDSTVNQIFLNEFTVGIISLYNFALLIKLDDDFNPDDAFFYYNQSFYTTINNYMTNQGNYQTKMYLVPCNIDYSLYYYGTSSGQQYTYLAGIELFNFYNGVINSNIYFPGNKVFINLVVNKYMNFYELNFMIDAFDIMNQDNKLCFDKNNLLFKMHKNCKIYDIIKYDSQRFNSNIPENITYWNSELILNLYNNKNFINYLKILDNNLVFILNCNKIINLFKRCIFYLRLIKNTIYFESLFLNGYDLCIEEELSKINHHNKWKNRTLLINEYTNIVNYLATCCVNINKTNQIINVTFCHEISTIDSILLILVYMTNNVTIQSINDYVLQLESGMIFYANRIELVQNEIYGIFTKIDDSYEFTVNPMLNYIPYKKQFIEILKEIYINNIVLFAINNDAFEIFNGIKINSIIKPQLHEFILNNLTEIVDIIEIYKLNINILLETLNFVRLFYFDNTVYGLYPVLTDNIIKTNYIYNTTYYNEQNGNNLPNINIFTYFPPNLTPSNLSDLVKNNIILLVQMLSDTYKVNYTTTPVLFGYNIYAKPDFKNFVDTLQNLIIYSDILYNLPDADNVPETYMKSYIYSWDLIKKFISNCQEVKLFIKCMFYLNKINKHISHNKLLCFFTNISEYINSIENIYSTIKNIITDPSLVITQYQDISNLLLEEISVKNTPIFSSNQNYLFVPYNQYPIMTIFLQGLYNLKITMLNKLDISIFSDTFNYFNLGYQGEDIIPFNDYNLLIDQRSLTYTVYPNPNNLYLPTANMHTFNSNLFILQLIQIFNNNKKIVNDTYALIDNSTMKYSLVFNALNYGYIHTNYVFINIDNINT